MTSSDNMSCHEGNTRSGSAFEVLSRRLLDLVGHQTEIDDIISATGS